MGTDVALLAGNGKQNLGHSVADIITHHITHKEHGEPDAHYRVNEVKPVGPRHHELVGEQFLNLPNKPLQQHARAGCEDAYQ